MSHAVHAVWLCHASVIINHHHALVKYEPRRPKTMPHRAPTKPCNLRTARSVFNATAAAESHREGVACCALVLGQAAMLRRIWTRRQPRLDKLGARLRQVCVIRAFGFTAPFLETVFVFPSVLSLEAQKASPQRLWPDLTPPVHRTTPARHYVRTTMVVVISVHRI